MTRKLLFLTALLIMSIAADVPAQIVVRPIRVPGSTSSTKFSPANPKMNAENYLAYWKPLNVLWFTPESVQFSGAKALLDSSLRVVYKPSAAGNHLLDLSVRKSGATSFTAVTIDGKNLVKQSFLQMDEKSMHVTFALNFADARGQVIYVFADQQWEFFDCEISQTK